MLSTIVLPVLLFLLPLAYSSTSILVPLYIFPTPGAWDPLTDALGNNTSVEFTIIVNPDSGPLPPDDVYPPAVEQLTAFPNVITIGYIRTGFGTRSAADIEGDIDTWATWPTAARPTGFFFDEVDSGEVAGSAAIMQTVTDYAHAQGFSGPIVFNPGTIPTDDSLFDIADQVVVFESPYSSYLEVADQVAAVQEPGSKLSVIINTIPSDDVTLTDLITTFSSRDYATFFFTDADGYTEFGSDWSSFASITATIESA